MFSKKDYIFYLVAGNIIGIIAGLCGASISTILFLSLLVPPAILVIWRLFINR